MTRQNVKETTLCWVENTPPEWRHEARALIDTIQFVVFADDIAEGFNGINDLDRATIWIRAISDDLTETAYFHELGHSLRDRLYGDPDGGHADLAFWRFVEEVPNLECRKSTMDNIVNRLPRYD